MAIAKRRTLQKKRSLYTAREMSGLPSVIYSGYARCLYEYGSLQSTALYQARSTKYSALSVRLAPIQRV